MRKVFLALMVAFALTGVVVAEDVVERPFVITDSQVIPEYPPAALAAGFEGAVGVAAMVNADGSVGTVEVIDSSGGKLGFEESAVDAMKQWSFSPARVNGDAVDSVYAYVFYFGGDRSGQGSGGNVFGQYVTSQLAGVGSSVAIGAQPPGEPGAKPGLTRGNFPSMVTAMSALVKVKKAPECQGCLYDRRDLIPPKSFGYDGPNRPN